jgi:hypothetical protein
VVITPPIAKLTPVVGTIIPATIPGELIQTIEDDGRALKQDGVTFGAENSEPLNFGDFTADKGIKLIVDAIAIGGKDIGDIDRMVSHFVLDGLYPTAGFILFGEGYFGLVLGQAALETKKR